MYLHRSPLSKRFTAAVLLALAACSADRPAETPEQPERLAELATPAAPPEANRPRPAAEEAEAAPGKVPLEAADLEKLRALGYAMDDASSAHGSSQSEVRAGAPDSLALTELQKKTLQSINQRANEAFDYLGVRRQRVAPKDADALDEQLAELRHYRDAASAGPALEGGSVSGRLAGERGRFDLSDPHEPARDQGSLSAAERFARERRALEGLRFLPSSGYWANTYVPGDPVMRWLESRLEERDRSEMQPFARRPLLLEAASHQTPQPFDPPGAAALSVFLQADRRGLEDESRMLLQVGLQGALRHSRLRPTMSVGIVFDLRGSPSIETARSLRALLDGFLEAKDVGDRFSLTVAGAPGGTVVGPEAFRHGPLSLAMAELLDPANGTRSGAPALSLEQAVRRTAAALQRTDDPDAPLGSSLVLLVTSQPLAPLTSNLAVLAHESAVAGVPVSVVGVGQSVSLEDLERVALAGQGNLRLLAEAAEAEGLVERELSALSRVIARALRLRIRLAPGVKLVSVVGSEPLDAAGAEQVRRAERSVDRRLAQNLGIEADRGEDEDGIQIVIPTFHSGDSHAVLIDLVAPGPGPIADVTIRYKDLVYLRNSVARANLTLGRSADPPGPLERNVVKNLLAIRLSETLKESGRELLAGRDQQAIAAVREFRTLLEGLQRETAGFQNDPALADDTRMLDEYLAVIEAGALDHDAPRQYLADSLQLSGYFKTTPRSGAAQQISRR
ncbi:MAG: hypothetical protein ACR2P8_13810 [Myxococcota bacterium]